jgi:hypothetical protein
VSVDLALISRIHLFIDEYIGMLFPLFRQSNVRVLDCFLYTASLLYKGKHFLLEKVICVGQNCLSFFLLWYVKFGIIQSFDFVHCPVFKIRLKQSISQTESVLIITQYNNLWAHRFRTPFPAGLNSVGVSFSLFPDEKHRSCPRNAVF